MTAAPLHVPVWLQMHPDYRDDHLLTDLPKCHLFGTASHVWHQMHPESPLEPSMWAGPPVGNFHSYVADLREALSAGDAVRTHGPCSKHRLFSSMMALITSGDAEEKLRG